MSLPPLFPQQTTAGISATSAGERVVATSRRADGTYRKELKIRPGYTPDEDITRFRSTRSGASDARAAVKGNIPGLKPTATTNSIGLNAALRGMSISVGGTGGKLSKAQKKNERRKIKRRDGADGASSSSSSDEEEPKKEKEETPDDWDNEESTPGELEEVEAQRLAEEEEKKKESEKSAGGGGGGEESKIRALKKKLRQAEQLREREVLGLYLPPAERAKVRGIEGIEEELKRLSVRS